VGVRSFSLWGAVVPELLCCFPQNIAQRCQGSPIEFAHPGTTRGMAMASHSTFRNKDVAKT
jgi:hypothetical protein